MLLEVLYGTVTPKSPRTADLFYTLQALQQAETDVVVFRQQVFVFPKMWKLKGKAMAPASRAGEVFSVRYN